MSIKTSDEILDELFNSLNLPVPVGNNIKQPVPSETVKGNALRNLEIYDEDGTIILKGDNYDLKIDTNRIIYAKPHTATIFKSIILIVLRLKAMLK